MHKIWFKFRKLFDFYHFGTTMRVGTDAQQQQLHLPIRMMSGRQLMEHEKITIENKWKIGENFTIMLTFCLSDLVQIQKKTNCKNSHIKTDDKAQTTVQKSISNGNQLAVLLGWLFVCYCHLYAMKCWVWKGKKCVEEAWMLCNFTYKQQQQSSHIHMKSGRQSTQ